MAVGDKHIPGEDGWPLCGAPQPMNGYYATSPPCPACRNLQGEREQRRQAPPRPARPSTFRILGESNGYGLSRDRAAITAAFLAAGWEADEKSAAVNVHLERAIPQEITTARRNVIVPNPEWWARELTSILRDPTVVVWAKTRDAERIFRKLGAHTVAYVGLRSADQLDSSLPRERLFLHVGGVGPNKRTAALWAAWRSEWPTLTITDASGRLTDGPNVRVLRTRLSSEEIRALQNRHLFHIYPSAYEGYGHAQWEGLSCGAVVFVQDGPPFDEDWPADRRLVPTGPGEPILDGIVTARIVSLEGIATAVERAWILIEGVERPRSRTLWEAAARDFDQRILEQIAQIDERRVSCAPRASGWLADVPPLTYVGRVNCVTGYGTAARHQIWALRRHGLRLHVVDAGSCEDPDPAREDLFVQEARRSSAAREETQGTIFHVAPNCVPEDRHTHPRPHILVFVWETTRLPQAWVPTVNSFDQVWCPTEWQREVCRQSGVDERVLRVVPFALDPAPRDGGVLPDVRTSGVVLGSVFQWTERKNPAALLGAYFAAFSGGDPVTLVLKSYERDSPSTSVAARVEEIARALRHPAPPRVNVLCRSLASREMAAFYRSIDCYVSAHCGEGFSFPIAEALLCGKPVIATDWSAPAEYAKGCFRGVRYVLAPPHGMDWQPFYTADQLWARADVEDLAQAMREAFEGRLACPVDCVRERFKQLLDRVGATAREALRDLL